VVTGLVARNGIAGNWLWWNMVASGMLTVFLFARLWRRSGVTTDIELAELRYSGKPAAFLRGFRALYLGVMNCIILGWVNLAMVKILMLVLGISKGQALWVVIGIIALTSFISTLSGLWGVLVTDLFQFAIKMTMVIVLGVAAVQSRRRHRSDEGENSAARAAPSSASCPTCIPLDARRHVLRLYRGELVGHLVSRRGARRRRLRRAAHVQREGRAQLAARHALVQRRALRAAAVAVGGRRDGVGDPLSAPAGSRNRLHVRVMIDYLPPRCAA
jgi:hypothetical protein